MAEAELLKHLVRQHEGRVRAFIGRRSGPEVRRQTTLDDIFQESVAEALRSAANYQYIDEDRFVAWMITIAKRIIARSVERSRRLPNQIRIKGPLSSGAGLPESRIPVNGRSPSSQAAYNENRRRSITYSINGNINY